MLDGESLNVVKEKLDRLKEVAPEVFTEEKVDWEKLKAALGEEIEFKDERYVLNWAGKSDAFRVLQSPATATLVPNRGESIDFDDTENVFIEGENLEVLKILQKSYFGKIKMIYIDPPYNTGNDNFIYPDKFSETKEEYLARIGDKDEAGYMTREGLFRRNSRDNGHYHSNWLSMMYPRLFLARNLLREDGAIFVSIDDNEVHNLRMIMNEVFGEENFIEQIIWKKTYGGGSKSKHIVGLHEYVLCFAKSKELVPTVNLPPNPEARKYYTGRDEKFNIRGPYRTQPLATTSMDERPNLRFPITWENEEIWPDKQWQWSQERVDFALRNNELIISKQSGKWSVRYKQYLYDENGEERSSKLFSVLEGPFTQIGTQEIKDLLGEGKILAFPKPSDLIKQFIATTWKEKNSIILDFFAGSATTAHAVLDLNKEDGGNRKFIMVQLPEECDEKSEAFRAGYKTIAEIGKERIRRVIEKIKEEKEGKLDFGEDKQDLGFKVFKLRESNFKNWRSKIKTEEELVGQLQGHIEPLDENAATEDVLYELLLKSGISLTAKIEGKENYFLIDGSGLVLILEKVNEEVIKRVIAERPGKVITLDRLFKGNDQLKTNTALQMKDAGIDFRAV